MQFEKHSSVTEGMISALLVMYFVEYDLSIAYLCGISIKLNK